MAYLIDVRIGFHTWSLERQESGETSDTVTVLDGLSFGWSMPTGLGPLQPDPMVASLQLNVPSFPDVADVEIGTEVVIEIRMDPSDPDPRFAFYGRVTDFQAAARTDFAPPKGRTGVTASLVAVDYTVDLVDLADWQYTDYDPDDPRIRGYDQYLGDIWDTHTSLGDLPAWPMPDHATGPNVAVTDGLTPVSDAVRALLLTTVDDDSTVRPILAPRIGAGGSLDAPAFAFDLVAKVPTSGWIVPAPVASRSAFQWRRNKRLSGNTIDVTSALGAHYRLTRDGGGKETSSRLTVIATDEDALPPIAEFYLADEIETASWVFDQFRLNLTRPVLVGDDADLPNDLMPRWWLDEGEPGRSSCYSKRIDLDFVSSDLIPYELDVDQFIGGTLDACTVNVQGGEITLDVRLRLLNLRGEHVVDPLPGDPYLETVLEHEPWGVWLEADVGEGDDLGLTILRDDSGNGHDLFVAGTGSDLDATGPGTHFPGFSWPVGTADYAETVDTFGTYTDGITLECWVYLDDQPAKNLRLIGTGDLTGFDHQNFNLCIAAPGASSKVYSAVQNAGFSVLLSSDSLSLDTWHHVVCYLTPDGVSFRIDKVDAGGVPTGGGYGLYGATADPFTTARTVNLHTVHDSGSTPPVIIAAPAVYDHLLTTAETDAHYDVAYS